MLGDNLFGCFSEPGPLAVLGRIQIGPPGLTEPIHQTALKHMRNEMPSDIALFVLNLANPQAFANDLHWGSNFRLSHLRNPFTHRFLESHDTTWNMPTRPVKAILPPGEQFLTAAICNQ